MAYIPKSNIEKPWITPRQPFDNRRKNPFYNKAEWSRFRKSIMLPPPLCVICAKEGIYTQATDLDHIKPINPDEPYNTEDGKYGEPLDENNVQPLCRRCHMSKSGKTNSR
jgi:5-methylcytosine-specific restriction protein A